MRTQSRDRSPPFSELPDASSRGRCRDRSVGAGSLSGSRRSRTLTTRIALPIARNPRATARPQPDGEPDRTTVERWRQAPHRTNRRRPPSRMHGWSAGRSSAAIRQPFGPALRSARRLSCKGGMPEEEHPKRHPRTGPGPIARCDRVCGRCVTWPPFPGPPTHSTSSNCKEINRWKRRQQRHRRRDVVYGVNDLELDLAGRRISGGVSGPRAGPEHPSRGEGDRQRRSGRRRIRRPAGRRDRVPQERRREGPAGLSNVGGRAAGVRIHSASRLQPR